MTRHGIKKMIEQLDPARKVTSKQIVLQVLAPMDTEIGEQGTKVVLSDGYSKIAAILPPKVATAVSNVYGFPINS